MIIMVEKDVVAAVSSTPKAVKLRRENAFKVNKTQQEPN